MEYYSRGLVRQRLYIQSYMSRDEEGRKKDASKVKQTKKQSNTAHPTSTSMHIHVGHLHDAAKQVNESLSAEPSKGYSPDFLYCVSVSGMLPRLPLPPIPPSSSWL